MVLRRGTTKLRRRPGAALTNPKANGNMDLPRFSARIAQVAELADALASGASGRKVVEVRVLSWAPFLRVASRIHATYRPICRA